jgi:uncharacterized protein (TIGR00297 family)
MNFDLARWALGFGLAAAISLAAYRARFLAPNGAIAATLVGTLVFGGARLPGAAVLLGFFLSSSLLTWAVNPRAAEAAEKFSKAGRRDASQVIANGGLAAILAGIVLPLAGSQAQVVWAALCGALAAANADTWATEIGMRFGRRPRVITTLAPAAPGTSGAVTAVGLAASVGGASLVALLSTLGGQPAAVWPVAASAAIGGTLGALADSLLGASLQAQYRCQSCGKLTEQHPRHRCGGSTVHIAGWVAVTNEVVNFACTTVGAAAAAALAYWLA